MKGNNMKILRQKLVNYTVGRNRIVALRATFLNSTTKLQPLKLLSSQTIYSFLVNTKLLSKYTDIFFLIIL